MAVHAVTHLNFRGDARAALEFYHAVFGGDLTVVTYAQMGTAQDSAAADQIMYGQVAADSGFRVMAYDVPAGTPWDRGRDPFFLSLRGETTEEVAAYWDKLAEGATVRQPLGPAQWAPAYGMLTDRFGVTWVVDVVAQYAAA